MKNLVKLSLLAILFLGCVSKSDYNALLEENKVLKSQIEELENGEERLVNLAKNSYEEGKYFQVDFYIRQLKEKHPESREIAYFKSIQPVLDSLIKEEFFLKEQAIQDSIKLANINNLGIWELGYYVDDFGEKTEKGYIFTQIFGNFSNSATTNSDLKIHFIIDENNIRIQLFEYARNHPVKGEGEIKFKVKDKNDEVHEIHASNGRNGYTEIYSFDDKKLREILMLGGKVQFIGQTTGRGTPSIYNFTIQNANWLENAITKMELSEKK